MSHKRKIDNLPIPEAKLQSYKTQHYENFNNLHKALLEERTRENGFNEQIRTKQRALAATRYNLTHAHTHPAQPQIQNLVNGWSIFHPDGKTASVELTKEQNKFEKEIEILKTQRKLSTERQTEIENASRNYPTWNKRVETGNYKNFK